ncbi:MAG: amidoligase family protein [Pseudomonadales bacterium]|nr:amidoligase family protein [Pseudomonadales bacterium]
MPEEFRIPPVTTDAEGKPRGAGFEFELGNLTIEEIADALHKRFGGEQKKLSAFEVHLIDSALGKIKVERDTQLLTSLSYREWLGSIGIDFSPGAEGEALEREVDKLSRWLVPCEIVTQPIGFDQLHLLHDLVEVFDEYKAQGTHMAPHYAFGLHINASTPDFAAETLLSYLQAFLLLADWIIQDAGTDITRRFFTNYIDPFPFVYARKILSASYQPGVEQLIEDYLEYNATRNRPLDMLPIFYMIAPDMVTNAIKEDERKLIKGRPAFHYRLPDCRVGQDGWSVADEWNRWQLVETIAAHHDSRAKLMELWDKEQSVFKLIPNTNWIKQMAGFIKDLELN